jgi:hypothetical protein
MFSKFEQYGKNVKAVQRKNQPATLESDPTPETTTPASPAQKSRYVFNLVSFLFFFDITKTICQN